jgi:hypothetical protein
MDAAIRLVLRNMAFSCDGALHDRQAHLSFHACPQKRCWLWFEGTAMSKGTTKWKIAPRIYFSRGIARGAIESVMVSSPYQAGA